MKLQAKLSYKEINDIIFSIEARKKKFKELGMKSAAYRMKQLSKKMKRIYEECDLITTLIYKKHN